jgi:ribosome-associated protein
MTLTSLRSRNAVPISQEQTAVTGILIEPNISTSGPESAVMPFRATPRAAARDGDLAPEALRDAILKALDDDKGEDVVVIDLKGRSNIADYMVIATGRSARQVGAMADRLLRTLQPGLSFRMAVEGLPQGDWVLVDCGDVIVHLFRPEVRDFYALEKMWGLEPPLLAAGGEPVTL